MNIVHLTTFYSGGAGRAAFRLHKALLEAGENSSMIFVENLNKYNGLTNCYSLSRQSIKTRLKNKLVRKIFARNMVEKKIFKAYFKLGIKNALLPFSNYNVLGHPVVKKADIIHLHWINGMIDYGYFFKRCKKNLIWTLHDVNPFNGLFFIENEPQLNTEEIKNLDREVRSIKMKAFNNLAAKMTITAPSKWLCAEAKQSELLGGFDCFTIPNIVDFDTFALRDKSSCRKELGIDDSKTVFLFISMAINDRWKGFDLLEDAFKDLPSETKNDIELIALGAGNRNDKHNLPINFIGEIKDNELLCKYYAAADALILPSRADNLPNVMLESLACGLPVISFPVGGIQEYIINGKTGYLAEEVSVTALKKAIKKFIETPKKFNKEAIREYAETHFNKLKITEEFRKVYCKNYISA